MSDEHEYAILYDAKDDGWYENEVLLGGEYAARLKLKEPEEDES